MRVINNTSNDEIRSYTANPQNKQQIPVFAWVRETPNGHFNETSCPKRAFSSVRANGNYANSQSVRPIFEPTSPSTTSKSFPPPSRLPQKQPQTNYLN